MTKHWHLTLTPSLCVSFIIFTFLFNNANSMYVVLDPEIKMHHFECHWTEELQDKIHESAEEIVSPLTHDYYLTSLLTLNSSRSTIFSYMEKVALLPIHRKSIMWSLQSSWKSIQAVMKMMLWHQLHQSPLHLPIHWNCGFLSLTNISMVLTRLWLTCLLLSGGVYVISIFCF